MRFEVALHFKFQSKMTDSLKSHFSVKYFLETFHLNLLSQRTIIEMFHCYDLVIVIFKQTIYLSLCHQFNLYVLCKNAS